MSTNDYEKIALSLPTITGDEVTEIAATLRDGWLAPAGPTLKAFEDALCAATGFKHCVCVSSGTAALHLILKSLAPPKGSRIWTSTLTFVGGVSAAYHMGLELVFLDVASDSWTLCPVLLEESLSKAKRNGDLPFAIISTDLYGQSCDIDTIAALCDTFGVHFISDSAEGLGALYKGRHAGRGTKAAALSFNGNKIISTGGGGAVLTDDVDIADHVRKLSQQARENVIWYEHVEIGFNYRMSSLAAAAGIAQIKHLPSFVAKRRSIFSGYSARLQHVPEISPMPVPTWSEPTHWLSVFTLSQHHGWDDVMRIVNAMSKAGIETRPAWKPMHLQPAFASCRAILNGTSEYVFNRGICLPSSQSLTESEQDRVVDVLVDSIRKA